MRTSNQRGFTLAEMLVAMVIAAVVGTFMFKTFFNSQHATNSLTDQIENRQNARTAMQLLERDLRMAGSGWGRIPVEGCYKGTPISILPIQPGYGGSNASQDTLELIGAWDYVTTLRTAQTSKTSDIKVSNATGLKANDFVVITNGTNAHLFQVTKVKTNDLEHDTGSYYNYSGGHNNWPTGGYPVGTFVYRATWVTYYVDASTGKRLMLVRKETGQSAQLVAYDLQQFKVNYLLQDSTETRNPDDPTTIDRVEPVVVTRSLTNTNKITLSDSASTIIRPRSF